MMAFQKDPITSNGRYLLRLSPGTYEVSGKMSKKLAVFFGSASTSPLIPKVETDSIRSNEGPVIQVFSCFILYNSESETPQPFRFQFTVSTNSNETCNATSTTNALFAQVSSVSDSPRDVIVVGQSIAIAGVSRLPGTNLNFFVRSFDAATGERRWQDEASAVPGLITSVFLTNTAETVFFAGYSPSIACCSDIFVRAYNAKTGRVLWTDVYDKGRDDLPQAIAVGSAAVVVVGYGGNTRTPPISGLDGLVRAYEPVTGSVLWEDRIDNGFLVDDVAWAVTIHDARVIVTGTSSTPEGPRVPFLRTYNATNGTLLTETSLAVTSAPPTIAGVDGTWDLFPELNH
jgi:PQQ-like domain